MFNENLSDVDDEHMFPESSRFDKQGFMMQQECSSSTAAMISLKKIPKAQSKREKRVENVSCSDVNTIQTIVDEINSDSSDQINKGQAFFQKKKKKKKRQRPQASKKPTIASKNEPLGAEMHKKAKDLRNITLKELKAARKEKLHPPEVSLPLGRETSLSPPQVNPSKVGVSAPLPSQGSPLISPSVLEATPSSQFDPSTGVMLHFVDEDSNLPSSSHNTQHPSVATYGEPVAPEIPVTSEATTLQVLACSTVTLNEPPSSSPGQTQGIGEGSGAAFSSPVRGREPSSQPFLVNLQGLVSKFWKKLLLLA